MRADDSAVSVPPIGRRGIASPAARLYREERLMVRRRGGRKRALGTRAPMLVPQWPNDRWSLDFASDQFIVPHAHPGRGRRLHVRVPGVGPRYLDLRYVLA